MASPYLIYAYHITDKLFYLGTGGGEILYHRSTPYVNEWGNWFSMDNVLGLGADEKEQPNVYSDLSELRKNHGPLYRKIQHLSYMERDSALRAEAFKNMKAHPRKYLQNTAASLSRFMFNFPSSYRTQNLNAVAYIIPNAFLLLCFVLAMFIIILRKKTLPFEIWCILIMSLIYGGGMVMLSGKGRYFIMMFPGLMLSSAYVLWHYQHISLITGRKK